MKTLILFFTTLTMLNASPITKSDEITYDFLVATGKQTGYCDHVPIFKTIFEAMPGKTLLEFGLGYSTKYFLDSCKKVISVEFISAGWSPDWFKRCMDLYKSYSNWVPVAYFTGYKGDYSWAPYKYFGSENLYKADSYFAANRQSYAAVDNSYQTELQTFISNLSKYNKIEIALVDPSNCLRGEIVQLLFGKVPVILTHDTGSSNLPNYDPYGFKNIQVPEDYEQIFIGKGVGTTVWIKKTDAYAELAQTLKDYAK